MRSAAPDTDWVASLSPWPADGFGLDRIRELLAELGNPQRQYPAVHIVGTNGKSTAARRIEALLAAEGVRVGTYLSPHVRGWSERIRIDGREADFEQAVGAVRTAAERVGATQFETLTAAALETFARQGVDAAVVEAGLGGRFDATNVLDARVVVLTNVGLEHTDVLGDTRAAIAREKLAVVAPGATVVLGEAEWDALARERGPAVVRVVEADDLPWAAAEAFLGRAPRGVAPPASLPGRLEVRCESPFELWDGAHNPDGARWLAERAPRRRYVLVLSILADKDVGEMLAAFALLGERAVVTASSNARALPAAELAAAAKGHFEAVEAVPDPGEALATARGLAAPGGAVLVTGSLYLLADLASREEQSSPCRNSETGSVSSRSPSASSWRSSG
jgi:dihydrofolate synthase/folylpolyglutamate synthase